MAEDKKDALSGPQKAAILLLTMGEEFTADIFRQLDDSEIKRLGRAMSKITNVTPEKVQQIMTEFVENVTTPTDLRIRGDSFLKSTMAKAITGDRIEGLLDEINSETGPVPFASLRGVDGKVLGNFIRSEHPQTIALILAHLDSDKAAQILSDYPEQLQVDVVLRIAELDTVPHQVVEEIEQVLNQEITALGSVGTQKLGGTQTVAEILNQVDQSTENAILTKIEEDKTDLANDIRKLMFVFDDLVNLDDRGVRAILKEVNNEELTMALKTASDTMRGKVFHNLSERAAEMIKEDLEVMGPVRLADVEKAQQAILRVAKKLEAEGKIVIGKSGAGEDVFV
jgi:flagellar motor switch protein FliG